MNWLGCESSDQIPGNSCAHALAQLGGRGQQERARIIMNCIYIIIRIDSQLLFGTVDVLLWR